MSTASRYPVEESSLADSSYDLVTTDGEGQDDRMTDSVSSLDGGYVRPDDVQSLPATDADLGTDYENGDVSQSEDEADDESRASSIAYTNQALLSPSSQLPASSFEITPPAAASSDPTEPVLSSIEFEEEQSPLGHDKISVKHTIRDFSEEESATISREMDFRNSPKRLIATIRQTMSHGCLKTKEPLRILYTGSPVARREIIYKLSSAIMASGKAAGGGEIACQNHDSLYTIVPISSFGSDREPEIELMESSGYQIKVEQVTSAREDIYKAQFFSTEAVLSLTVDGDKTYKSAFSPSGSLVRPQWSLPHVAIFFITEGDDLQTERTRDTAVSFMNRHSIPCIFISHRQSFTRAARIWSECMSQHAIHLSLESRDPDRPSPPRRLPIDLASFLTIDARQMNRNLAYLTGLTEPTAVSDGKDRTEMADFYNVARQARTRTTDFLNAAYKSMLDAWGTNWRAFTTTEFSRSWVLAYIWLILVFVVPLPLILISPLLASQTRVVSGPAGTSSYAPSATSSYSAVSSIPTATTTITINLTSTKTVQVVHSETSASVLASALNFGGLLADRDQGAAHRTKSKEAALCSVEKVSSNEVLVKIPSGSKESWLARDAIKFDIVRPGGGQVLDLKFSSVDLGILIEIPRREAHGVLNVSVVTKRKPKINESFEVTFEKDVVANMLEYGFHVLQGVSQTAADQAGRAAHLVEGSITSIASEAEKVLMAAKDTRARYSDVKEKIKANVKAKLAERIPTADTLRKDAEMTLLKAQIASKLWWLKFQGKTKEYQSYENNAKAYLRKTLEEWSNARERKPHTKKMKAKAEKTAADSERIEAYAKKWKEFDAQMKVYEVNKKKVVQRIEEMQRADKNSDEFTEWKRMATEWKRTATLNEIEDEYEHEVYTFQTQIMRLRNDFKKKMAQMAAKRTSSPTCTFWSKRCGRCREPNTDDEVQRMETEHTTFMDTLSEKHLKRMERLSRRMQDMVALWDR